MYVGIILPFFHSSIMSYSKDKNMYMSKSHTHTHTHTGTLQNARELLYTLVEESRHTPVSILRTFGDRVTTL